MKRKVYVADLNWLKPSEGGRQLPIPMHNNKYCPIVAVDGIKDYLGSSFSLICDSFQKIEELRTLAYVTYLNEERSPKNLYVGAKIDLYEGKKLVATGEIIKYID